MVTNKVFMCFFSFLFIIVINNIVYALDENTLQRLYEYQKMKDEEALATGFFILCSIIFGISLAVSYVFGKKRLSYLRAKRSPELSQKVEEWLALSEMANDLKLAGIAGVLLYIFSKGLKQSEEANFLLISFVFIFVGYLGFGSFYSLKSRKILKSIKRMKKKQ